MADIDFLRPLNRRWRPGRLVVLLCVLLGLLLGGAGYRVLNYYGKVLRDTKAFREQRTVIQRELASHKGTLEKKNQMAQQEKALQDKRALMESLENGRRWSDALKDLSSRVPVSVSLTEVVAASDQLVIRGISPDLAALAKFEQQLGKSSRLPKFDLKYAMEDGQSGSYSFELQFGSPVQKVGARQ